MADIEIGPLADSLADDEVIHLKNQLEKLGVARLPVEDDEGAATLARGVDDDVLAEFLDRLDAYDMACDIYLPAEFEGRIEVGDRRVGSVQSLLEVLEELKEELSVEDHEDEDEDADDEDEDADEDADEDEDAEEEEDEDDEGQLELIDAQIRSVWKVIYDGAQTSLRRKLPLYVRTA